MGRSVMYVGYISVAIRAYQQTADAMNHKVILSLSHLNQHVLYAPIVEEISLIVLISHTTALADSVKNGRRFGLFMTGRHKMGDIPFTQYLMPNGKTIAVTINRPNNVSNKADELLKKGYKFECETLRTGDISLTIVRDGEDIDGELCPNGPKVLLAVDTLIERVSLEAPDDS